MSFDESPSAPELTGISNFVPSSRAIRLSGSVSPESATPIEVAVPPIVAIRSCATRSPALSAKSWT